MRVWRNIPWLLLVLPVLGWGEFFEITDYHVRASLHSNGTMTMEETITVLFYEPRHGIYRTLPTRLKGDRFDHRFRIEKVWVKDSDFTTSYEGSLLKIRIGSPSRYVEGTQVYHIGYTVHNPILVFTNDEGLPWQAFYWNLIGTDWEVPIRHASFEVILDKVWEKPDFSVFAGKYGSPNVERVEALYESSTRTLRGRLVGELAPREGITILASFPMGFWPVYDERTFWQKYGYVLSWLVAVFYTGGLFLLWMRFGKDKPFVKMVHFYPPSDLDPAEAGMLIDNTIDQRDVIATIFKWATAGYISIEEKRGVLGIGRDFVFHKKKPLENPKPYECVLWAGLFVKEGVSASFRSQAKIFQPSDFGLEERESVALSSLKNEFYKAFELAKDEIAEGVREKSLYKPYSRELGWACTFFGIFWIAWGFPFAFATESWYMVPVSLLLSIVSFFFGSIMPARTEIGQKYYEQVVGFREFVKRADWPRLERILRDDPLYFDKTLPYAIVFGLEKTWTQKFSPVLTTAPAWYGGTGPFTPMYLSSAIHSSIQSMGTVMTSSPSSTGSGGGGFSGGGGGGGGGGSW
ncbi:MAG: DUF2207 domain-containing protein [Brevinematales bacterium]|nr:DUF2207 domain-containing protein [Brevinematales bacterium]